MSQDFSIIVISKSVPEHVRIIAYEVALHSLNVKRVSFFWNNMNIRNAAKNSQVRTLEFFSSPYFFWQFELQEYWRSSIDQISSLYS